MFRLCFIVLVFIVGSLNANKLHNSIQSGNPEDALRMIESAQRDNLNLNELDEFGLSALHLAVQKFQIKVVDALLNAGANANIVSTGSIQVSPLEIAYGLDGDTANLITALRQHGAEFKHRMLKKPCRDLSNSRCLATIANEKDSFKKLLELVLRQNNQNDQEILPLMPFIYPLFVSEKTLFTLLQEKAFAKYSYSIQQLFSYIAISEFPNGVSKIEESSRKLEQLTKLYNISPEIITTIIKNLQSYREQQSEKSLKKAVLCRSHREKIYFNFEEIDIQKLAVVKTLLESHLFQNLTYNEIRTYKKNSNIKNNYAALTHHFDKFVNYLVLQMAGEKKNKKNMRKVIKLGQEFLKLNNINGLEQVVRALEHKSIKDIFKEDSKEFKKRKNLLDKAKKYSKIDRYREEIAYLLKDGRPVLPVISKVVNDILISMHAIDPSRYQPQQLKNLWQKSKEFCELKQCSFNYDFPTKNSDEDSKLYEFISSLKLTDDSTLEIYQQMRDKNRLSFSCPPEKSKTTQERALANYDSYDLLWILQKQSMTYAIYELFAHNIYDGWALIKYFDASPNESEKLTKLDTWTLTHSDKTKLFNLYTSFKAMSTSPRNRPTNIETETESSASSQKIILRKRTHSKTR